MRVSCIPQALLGFLKFHYLVIRHGGYRGGGEIRKRWQLGDRALATYLETERSLKKPILDDYVFAITEATRDRPSSRAIEQYSDDSLHGYGDETYDKGGDTIEQQQRGLILPMLERAINDSDGDILEIGTGNGDVIAYLAVKYPARNFVGVDFSVSTAQRKWCLPNLRFIKGYARDAIRHIDRQVEVVFASSTFILFTPLELAAYCRAFNEIGVQQVVLSEPQWYGLSDSSMLDMSIHMEGSLWFHAYRKYLEPEGYTVTIEEIPYKHPASPRPDITLTLLHARL